ncbi:MAG: glucose-6-phosphate dehydrogenase [Desulfobulbaceae bacterium]|nr:glucose-6-phosphate dehydrogenase [Desulfobulbaceae bacterium]
MKTPHACDLLPSGDVAPCIIVIFGGSGDLTRRKLIPALYYLYQQKKMPDKFAVVCCGRTTYTNEQFRQQLLLSYENGDLNLSNWDEFAANLYYHSLTYTAEAFLNLKDYLYKLDSHHSTEANRIYDLAVPPNLYPIIAELLGKSHMATEQVQGNGWSRIIIEKPFGHDLESARQLNEVLHDYFTEEQIFRIDHYLAKETVQNVLIFRFANTIFEPVWNSHYIDYIGIIASEELGVGNRAGYYDTAGVLRDMFQNHMMQLLVLTAMESPYRFEANAIQDEKAKVIHSLRNFCIDSGSKIHLGQYGPGEINGFMVPGYREEKNIPAGSTTPTFALMELYIDNWRWRNVPFYLVSGKRMAKKETRIVIQFKKTPHQLFRSPFGESTANKLIIETYPQESIKLSFQTKNPGHNLCLRSMYMDFVYQEHYHNISSNAYARVLLDCIGGDHTLFWRQDGIELSWSFLTPILQQCENRQKIMPPLQFYPAGSLGPTSSEKIIQTLFTD